MEDLLGGGQPLTFSCDDVLHFWSSVEDCGLGGERACTKRTVDSSNVTTLSLPVSSPATTAADLSPGSPALFFGPEENPSSLIS